MGGEIAVGERDTDTARYLPLGNCDVIYVLRVQGAHYQLMLLCNQCPGPRGREFDTSISYPVSIQSFDSFAG